MQIQFFWTWKRGCFYPPHICGPWHQNKWTILSGRAAETGDAARCRCNFRRLLHFIMQNSAPANRARETVVLLQWQVPSCIAANLWPPNSPDLNTVDYKVWGTMQDHVYWAKVRDVNDLKHVWLMCRTGQSGAKHHWRRDRPEAFTTLCPCPCKRGTFWTV